MAPAAGATTLIVTDLDGTLWDNSMRCHPATIAAVRELDRRDDVELIAATGRRRNSAGRGFDANGIAMPAVLLNGSVGFDFVRDELFHLISFTNEALRSVLDVLDADGVRPVAYLADTTAVAVEGVLTSARHLDTLEGDLVWWTLDELAERDDVLGLSMLGVATDRLAQVHAQLQLEQSAEAHLFVDHLYPPGSMMVAPVGVHKQRGIEAWLERRSTGGAATVGRVIAIGDAGNDVPMLQAADVAVAVRTAFPEVKALAHHEIGPPAEGGWAEVLELI